MQGFQRRQSGDRYIVETFGSESPVPVVPVVSEIASATGGDGLASLTVIDFTGIPASCLNEPRPEFPVVAVFYSS